jgi:hypothetical protein
VHDPVHLWGALAYSAIPFAIGAYLLLIDSGVLKDRSGRDDLYRWIRENLIAWFAVGGALMTLAAFEFFRFLGALE